MTSIETNAWTKSGDGLLRHELTERSVIEPLLPLVSVIIVNHNYDRYLEAAIDSVFEQTYPRIECLVVDNASTDGSSAVLASCLERHPALSVFFRPTNGGQTSACFDGVERTRGSYVIFLDADDYLLPRCVETHIQVHLSSRVHVGFTSGDMLQMVGDEVVVSTNEAMATFLRTPRDDEATDRRVGLLRPSRAGLLGLWSSYDHGLCERTHLIAQSQTGWVWSPTSGNCFRRDALALFQDSEGLGTLRSQTDLFLALGINAVCGSILIDEPLFVYRLHGSNAFSSGAQLCGRLVFDAEKTKANTRIARHLLLDQLVKRSKRFVTERWQAYSLADILVRLDCENPGASSHWSRKSYAATTATRHISALAKAVGKGHALRILAKLNVPGHVILRLSLFLPRGPRDADPINPA